MLASWQKNQISIDTRTTTFSERMMMMLYIHYKL